MATDFELEGQRFEVQRLKIDDACLGLEVLGRALGPAASAVLGLGSAVDGEAAKPDYGAILQALLTQASQASALLKLFAKVSKFDRLGDGNMVALTPFLEDVFGGRLDLMVAFLVRSAKAEFASFLDGGALAALIPATPPKG